MAAGHVGITPEETAIFVDALARVTNKLCEEVMRRPFPHLDIARIPAGELPGSLYLPFVYGSFQASLNRPSWQLRDQLRRPGALVLVAMPVDGDVFIGWLACVPSENRVIAAFTKAAYRASPEQRQGKEENADAFRIASSLAIAGGITFDRPVMCSFWSRAARAIAAKAGNPYALRFDPE